MMMGVKCGMEVFDVVVWLGTSTNPACESYDQSNILLEWYF